jgi:hypothetical protein
VRVRSVLIITAVLSSILGAVVVYLVLTVPNDVAAATLMRAARRDVAAGENEKAREELSRIVQQYPRTDAAAAATVALVSLGDAEQLRLASAVVELLRSNAAQQKQLADLAARVARIESTPPPAPVVVHAAPKKKAPKRSTRRRRR